MRPCGDCRLCCKVFPLPILDKPAGTWCRHATSAGCAIHGLPRPEVCCQYDCFWREHDELPDAWRPDRIGIVVTEAGNVQIGYRFLPVVIFQVDDSQRPLASAASSRLTASDSATMHGAPEGEAPKAIAETGQGDAARMLLDYFVARGVAVMIIHGAQARIEFDRQRYGGISPEEIEAALRYELSQDAEELKRLGAVGDHYRPLSRNEAEAACRADKSAAQSCQEGTCQP
jgi:hypothetical protein